MLMDVFLYILMDVYDSPWIKCCNEINWVHWMSITQS